VLEFAQAIVTSSAISDDSTVLAYSAGKRVYFFDLYKLKSLREINLNFEVVGI